MNRNYYTKKVEKTLRDLCLYRASLDYFTGISACSDTSRTVQKKIGKKVTLLEHTVSTVESALKILDPIEQRVVTLLYLDSGISVEDACELCCLERSSIYRYRKSALTKLAKILYGIVE